MDIVRVMVVEDDFMVAKINREVTDQLEGFTVTNVALNGKDALLALEQGGIDLVVLDIYLPDIHGIELLKEARRKEYAVDFILITAAHDARTIEESMRFGVVDYIIKPFDFERYKSALRDYLRRKETLSSKGYLDQQGLDIVLDNRPSALTTTILPKGISKLTLAKVTSAIDRTRSKIVADDLADQLSLSRITARRYLEYLAETGYLRRDLEYQKIGRPLVSYFKIDR